MVPPFFWGGEDVREIPPHDYWFYSAIGSDFQILDDKNESIYGKVLTDEGWIGGKPSEQLYMSLLREYKLQSEARTSEIEEQAKKEYVKVRSIIKSGAILEQTLKIVTLEDPDLIVISRRKRSSLSRLIFGSLANALQKRVRCEVRIIDSE